MKDHFSSARSDNPQAQYYQNMVHDKRDNIIARGVKDSSKQNSTNATTQPTRYFTNRNSRITHKSLDGWYSNKY